MGRRAKDKFLDERVNSPLTPLNMRQSVLINFINKKPMVVTTGYAGTGKTYVPAVMAADALLLTEARGGTDKIILTRPNVASGRPLGFRPGTLKEKMLEWFAETLAILQERMGTEKFTYAMNKDQIEMVPFESMRGRTFNNAWVLLDEAQNITPGEMKMFVTRIGQNSKVVVNGDVRQSDLTSASGLMTLIEIIDRYDMDVPVIDFKAEDIVRSDLCREFIVNWMDYEHSA